ncbi:hypothetical protein E8E13_006031 [Curvularia kusanoi]|uniref:Fungal calcium binding protein domain-containing protein n=1 Tax=Curvularia kusanoi TaxID=90978 RepID=A0A9P4T7Z4_CURKU|nr:hypothetical protein E8E13_006031 [Curvularia kusanoi]
MAVATASTTVVTAPNTAHTLDPVEHFIVTSNDTVQSLIHLGCKFKTCLEVLAPTIATCALALAQEEFDVINDALCFSSAAKELHKKPAECKGCW